MTTAQIDRPISRQNAANETNNVVDNAIEKGQQNASVRMFRKVSESQLRTKLSPEAPLCPRVNCPEKIVSDPPRTEGKLFQNNNNNIDIVGLVFGFRQFNSVITL